MPDNPLKTAREAQEKITQEKITLEDMAALLGVTPQRVNQWENGQAVPLKRLKQWTEDKALPSWVRLVAHEMLKAEIAKKMGELLDVMNPAKHQSTTP